MDLGYAPYEDLPKRLRKAMLWLWHYENLVSAQVSRVVDAAAAEWLAVEKRAEDSAAVIAREEGRARDRATCVAAIDNRKAATTTVRFESLTAAMLPRIAAAVPLSLCCCCACQCRSCLAAAVHGALASLLLCRSCVAAAVPLSPRCCRTAPAWLLLHVALSQRSCCGTLNRTAAAQAVVLSHHCCCAALA